MAVTNAIAIVRMKFLPRYRRVFLCGIVMPSVGARQFPGREGIGSVNADFTLKCVEKPRSCRGHSTKQSTAPLAGAAMDGLE
jgi:hypothetical protein